MTDRKDLGRRLDALEEEFGVGERDPTLLMLVIPEVATRGEDPPTWPKDVTRADIVVAHPERDIEQIIAPHYRPPEHRGAVLTATEPEIAAMWAAQPDEVREHELALRIERGDPIPPILQQ